MKQLISFLFFIACFVIASGQKNYAEAIQLGDDAFNKQQYKKAINKYFAAEAFDPDKKDSVKIKVNMVFDAIEALRKKAVTDAERAKKATKNETFAKEQVIATLKNINTFTSKLFYPFGFYSTYDSANNYYFVDNYLNKVNRLGVWSHAKQFDERGWVGVILNITDEYSTHSIHYLMDTTGKYFKVAYDIKDVDSSVRILDLYKQKVDSLPVDVLANKDLRILGLEKPREFYFPLMKVKYSNDSTLYGYFDTIHKNLYDHCLGKLLSNNKNVISNIKITKSDILEACSGPRINVPRMNISFATGTSKLLSKSFKTLNDLAGIANDNPGWKIAVEAHTDDVGNADWNRELSLQRALAIKYYLVNNRGVAWDRISTSGYGGDRPVATNATTAGRAKNARVEIQIINY